MHIILLVDKNR